MCAVDSLAAFWFRHHRTLVCDPCFGTQIRYLNGLTVNLPKKIYSPIQREVTFIHMEATFVNLKLNLIWGFVIRSPRHQLSYSPSCEYDISFLLLWEVILCLYSFHSPKHCPYVRIRVQIEFTFPIQEYETKIIQRRKQDYRVVYHKVIL